MRHLTNAQNSIMKINSPGLLRSVCDGGGDLLLGGGHPVAQTALQTPECGKLVGAQLAPILQPHHPQRHPEQHHRPWRRR